MSLFRIFTFEIFYRSRVPDSYCLARCSYRIARASLSYRLALGSFLRMRSIQVRYNFISSITLSRKNSERYASLYSTFASRTIGLWKGTSKGTLTFRLCMLVGNLNSAGTP